MFELNHQFSQEMENMELTAFFPLPHELGCLSMCLMNNVAWPLFRNEVEIWRNEICVL